MAGPVVYETFGANATNVLAVTISSISTTQTDYVLLLAIYNENHGAAAPTITSVTSAGLTWALRRRSNGSATGCLELWWAHGTGTLSAYSVTANFSGAYDDACLALMVVAGLGNSAAPFDVNASFPAAQSAPNNAWTPSFTSISTSNAEDMLLFITGTISGGGTPGTGFANIINRSNNGGTWASRLYMDEQSITALQSSATFTYGSALNNGFSSVICAEAILDAVVGTNTPALANTTWNPSDRLGTFAFYNRNLSVTNYITSGNAGLRSVASRVSGKYYWEYRINNETNSAVGIATGTVALSTLGQNGAAGAAYVNRAGTVYSNSGTSVATLPSFVNNSLCCIALDLDNQRIWLKNGAAGQWNGSGTANPATNTGGLACTFVGGGVAAYALWSGANSNPDEISANFGDSAFTGTVPSGFASGFPGVAVATARQYAVTVVT